MPTMSSEAHDLHPYRRLPENLQPKRMKNTIALIFNVSFIESMKTGLLAFPYKNVNTTLPTTPSAAASDGVAIPRKINPVTRNMMNPKGAKVNRARNFSPQVNSGDLLFRGQGGG